MRTPDNQRPWKFEKQILKLFVQPKADAEFKEHNSNHDELPVAFKEESHEENSQTYSKLPHNLNKNYIKSINSNTLSNTNLNIDFNFNTIKKKNTFKLHKKKIFK